MKNKKYKEYKKLKGLLEGKSYKGYPLHLVLGSYLGMMIWKPSLSRFIRYILLNVKNFKFPNSEKTINTFSVKRDDYLDLIKAYFPDSKPQYLRVDNGNKQEKPVLSAFMSITAFVRSCIFASTIKCSLKERLKLIVALSIAFKVIDELEKQNIQCEKYIAFNSSYLIESFLCYYFRKRGVKTYSLQHGMYFNYINDTPFDVINFENICANELLVWGEYSKKEIELLIPKSSSCMVFGYPKSRFPTVLSPAPMDKVLVLLPRNIYLDNTFLLLEYLKKYDLQYIVRPHPSVAAEVKQVVEPQKNFELDTNAILSETLAKFKYKAVISFNSTAVFEAALCEQNVFLFTTDKDEFRNPGFREFDLDSNFADELDKNINRIGSRFFSRVTVDL
jgi:hypothetical protein